MDNDYMVIFRTNYNGYSGLMYSLDKIFGIYEKSLNSVDGYKKEYEELKRLRIELGNDVMEKGFRPAQKTIVIYMENGVVDIPEFLKLGSSRSQLEKAFDIFDSAIHDESDTADFYRKRIDKLESEISRLEGLIGELELRLEGDSDAEYNNRDIF